MLGRDVVPARDIRDNGARREGFRDDPSLGLIAPPSATPRTDLDIDPTPWLRTVDYMVNHICEPNCVRWVASCSSTRDRQGRERRPLTLQWPAQSNYRLKAEDVHGVPPFGSLSVLSCSGTARHPHPAIATPRSPRIDLW